MGRDRNYIKEIRSKVGHDKIILAFAGGCVFNDKGEVLLQRRGDSNLWGFPGGAVELGETPQMAAIREIKEETGLDVEVGRAIGVYSDLDISYASGDRAQSIVIAFELKPIGGELCCDFTETMELRYFSAEEKPKLFTKSHEDLWNEIFPESGLQNNVRELQGANMDIDLTSENIGWNQVSCPWNEAENTTVHKCAVKNISICKYFCGIKYLDSVLCSYPHGNKDE